MSILVPVSTSDKVVSFSDHARHKAELGELNYEQFCNIEMLELGYIPSNPKDVLEYKHFIESLSEEDFKIDSRYIICSECSAQHLVIHMEWESIVCLHCSYEICNPEKEV